MLSSYIGRIYKDIAGKGPENVYVAFGNQCYVIYLKNYFMPYEKLIKQEGDMDLLYKVMHVTIKNLNNQIVKYTDFITGISTEEIYYDWNMGTGSRILVGIAKGQYYMCSKGRR